MKRTVLIVLVLLLVVSMFACNGNNQDVAEIELNENTLNTIQTESQNTNVTDNAFQPKEAFQLGSVNGNTYENKFFGIKCVVDKSWRFYTSEEIAELNKISLSNFDEDFVEIYKNRDTFIDMYAGEKGGYNNVNVSVNRLTDEEIEAFDSIETLENTIDVLKGTFENMGYRNCNFEVQKVTVDGKKYDSYFCTADIGEKKFYQKQFSLIRRGYCVSITATSYVNDICDKLLNQWTIYNI